MRVSNIVSLVFLLASTTEAYELSREQEDSLARALAEETPGSGLLQRCSQAGADDDCDEGLECVSVGILLNRCLPLACLEEKLTAVDEEEDLDAYAQYIDETAGVTTLALIRQSIQAWWADEPQYENSLHTAMRAAVAENPVPAEKIKLAIQDCTASSINARQDNPFLVSYDGEKTASGFFLTESTANFQTSNNRFINRSCSGIATIGEVTMNLFGLMIDPPPSFEARDVIMVGTEASLFFGGGLMVGTSFTNGLSLYLEFGFGTGSFGGNGGIFFCNEYAV